MKQKIKKRYGLPGSTEAKQGGKMLSLHQGPFMTVTDVTPAMLGSP